MSDEHVIRMPDLGIADLANTIRENKLADDRRQAEIAGRFDAADILEHLMRRVEKFQRNLKESEEIGLQLANFGLAAQIHIRQIGYKNPNLIEFQGIDADENEVVLIQHISQLNFMLIALKPIEEKPYRIGF